MTEIHQLCVRAAHIIFATDAALSTRPAVLGSDDGVALTVLTAVADPSLKNEDVTLALRSFNWVLHVRACTVIGWRPNGMTSSAPEAVVGVDCYSASGRWQAVLGVRDGQLQTSSSFREVVELLPLSDWRFADTGTSPSRSDEPNWAQYAYRQQTEMGADPIGQIEAEIAHNYQQIHDLKNGLRMRLVFSPVVAYDFAQHSAAPDLEALGKLATGLTDPIALLGKLAAAADTVRMSHCASLLNSFIGKLPRSEEARFTRLLERPICEAIAELVPHKMLPEAQALIYWITSADHDAEGVGMTNLAKTFDTGPKPFEAALALSPLVFSSTCPICECNALYDVERFSVGSGLITFRMHCDACGHQEAYHRSEGWTSGQVTCGCKTCVKAQRQACAVHLPRVVIALEEALIAAPGLASEAVRDAVSRIATTSMDLPDGKQSGKNPDGVTEWTAKHVVYLGGVEQDDPGPAHQFHPTMRLGGVGVGAIDEVVHAMSSLNPTDVDYLEYTLRESDMPGDAFAFLPGCIELLLDGDNLAPSQMLSTWTTALGASGLLHADRAQFEKLAVAPYGWMNCNFSSVKQKEIQTQKDLVVSREVPKAEELMFIIRDAIVQDDESNSYAETVITAGHAAAPAHGRHLLELARAIKIPEAQDVLQKLEQNQPVSVELLRSAREAFGRERDNAALFYAALLWNYSYPLTGSNKAPLVFSKLALFSSTLTAAARERHAVKTNISCRRCGNEGASMTFWREKLSYDRWNIDCKECGHVEVSLQYNYRNGSEFCDCQHCANAASVALKGKSTASLLSEVVSYCVVEAHALSSRSTSDVIAEQSELSDLLPGVKYNSDKAEFIRTYASRAVWKTLRFNTSAGLLYHVLPHYWKMPTLEDLSLLTENHSPTLSRAALRVLHKLWHIMLPAYDTKHLRFPLPLCVVVSDTAQPPKVRTRKGANTA